MLNVTAHLFPQTGKWACATACIIGIIFQLASQPLSLTIF